MSQFRPVRGLEEIILNAAYSDGYVYFATDTGKIYIDALGERIPMGGGGVNVLYSEAQNVIERPDDTYQMKVSDLEDKGANPKTDDLVINKDGRFFKIMTANKDLDELICTLIAVSGTGGGGGGGGDTPSGAGVTLELVGTSIPMSFIVGQAYDAQFKATATDDTSLTITCKVIYADNTYAEKTGTMLSGSTHTFDIGNMVREGTNKIIITAQGENSGSAQKSYSNRKGIIMELKPSTDFFPLKINTGIMNFACIPVGAGISKDLKVVIDNSQTFEVKNITSSEQKVTVPIPAMNHGKHTLVATLTSGSVSATPLTYEVMWVQEGNTTPIVLLGDYPSTITNYEDLKIKYMVYDPTSSNASVHYYLNQQELANSPLTKTYNETTYHEWNVTDYVVGNNSFSITCGDAIPATFSVFVKEDTSRDLDIIDGADLYFNLSSAGRSNEENVTSRNVWEYTNDNGLTTAAIFEGFNWYNNGWINDSDGNACLRVSNGAKVKIPLDLMKTQKLVTGLTFEFQLRLRNVQNYSTLITTTSSETDNGDVIITKTINTEEGVCGSYYNNGIGMCIGTQEAFFKSSNVTGAVSARYKEDVLMNLTFVVEKKGDQNYDPLMHIYINGIDSGILPYADSESFASNAKELVFNSDYCDVDIYKIRVYIAPLSSVDVVHNFIADHKDVALYDVNKIVKYNNGIPQIDYTLLRQYNLDNPSNPTMPVAIIQMIDDDNNGERLPYVKDTKRKCNIEFINYSLDYAYENKEITNIKYISGCPSFYATNVEGDVQGTSSQGYPRRNFKFKFKKADSWEYTNGPLKGQPINEKHIVNGKEFKGYYMDNEDASETTFTWKADYMESSGTHNTGFTSFVKELYGKGDDNFNVHPLQDYVDAYANISNMPNYRTTIYGFPMLVFQKFNDGHYEYVGKYNFNLDKGCDNVCGFTDPHDSKVKDENGKYLPFEKVAECWELCNNKGTRCSFNVVNFAETNASGQLTVLEDFEVRYNYYKDDIEDAAKVNNNEYILSKYANLEKFANWLNSVNQSQARGAALPQAVTYDGVQYTNDTAAYRLAKFKAEFDQHLDFQYCAVYYIMTELIIGYDSRGKNMMLASWGPKVEGGEYIWYPIFYDVDTQLGVNNSGVPSWDYFEEPSRDGTFSTSDSVLWVNFGQAFNTRIQDVYHKLRIDPNGLNFTTLNGYYDYDPAVSKSYAMKGLRPYNAYNIDEYYKYISPTRDGYTAPDGKLNATNDAGRHYYCLQGTRELQRELFLRNRFNYVDSKWQADSYHGETLTKFRYNANDLRTSDVYVTEQPYDDQGNPKDGYIVQEYGVSPLDANADFTITPYLKQYAYAKFDGDRVSTELPFFDGENPVVSTPPASVQESIEKVAPFTEQLVYFGGAEYISSFGDLSRKYINEISVNTATRLKDFLLGSDIPGYRNQSMRQGSFSFISKLNDPTAKPLLQTVLLNNLPTVDGTLILTGSEKLREFRALNTGLSSIEFAQGVQLQIAHLPKSLTNLALIEPVALNGLLTKSQVDAMYDAGVFTPGLYIEELLEQPNSIDARTHLTNINIVGGQMGYDTYKLADKVIKIKQKMQVVPAADLSEGGYNPNLYIDLLDVNWSPYRLVAYGEVPVDGKTYVMKTDHYSFREMTSAERAKWETHTLNGVVYEYDTTFAGSSHANTITDLSLLDAFIASFESDEQYFRSNDEVGGIKIPQITGTMFINNSADNEIDEIELKTNYIDKYFPDLDIQVAHVKEASTLKLLEVIDAEKEHYKVVEVRKYAEDKIWPDDYEEWPTPIKNYYSFAGWSLSPTSGSIFPVERYNELKFSEKKVQVLYAVYDRAGQIITFKNYDGTQLTTTTGYFDEPLVAPNIMPYKNDENLIPITQTWAFKGWTTDSNKTELTSSMNPSDVLVDLSKLYGDREWVFYAVYAQDSVYNNVADTKFFIFTPDNGYSEQNAPQFNTGPSVRLTVKPEYKGVLRGKITIPTIDPVTGRAVSMIESNAFEGTQVTYVFFDKLGMSNVRQFGQFGFSDCPNLRYVELPNNLRIIGSSCFARTTRLSTHQNFQDLAGEGRLEIGNNVFSIGSSAFNQSGSGYKTLSIVVGGSVTEIGESAFNYINTSKGTIEFGSNEKPTSVSLIGPILNQNPDYVPSTVYVFCRTADSDRMAQYQTNGYFGTPSVSIKKTDSK